jgi:lysine 6-dehydrogenase
MAVIGSGLMGRAVAYDLCRIEDVTRVGLFDFDYDLAEEIARKFGNDKAHAGQVDARDVEQVAKLLGDYDACISAVTYRFNPGLTRAAIASRTHFFDLGGNNDVVRAQFEMDEAARQADIVVIPDCGLAPGMASILAADGINRFDKVISVKIRVGGLPQNPRPPLNYQMVFNPEGLINEYWEPVVILENGEKKTVNPLTGLETLAFDGIGELEAFYTSGGISTLPDTFMGAVDSMDYKTIRYPGHCRIFRPMLELGLGSRSKVKVGRVDIEPRAVLKKVLEKNITFNDPDMVLLRVIVEGLSDDRQGKVIYEIVDRQDMRTGLTSMMRTTAFPAAIIAWMATGGKITYRGVIPQELAIEPKFFIQQLKKRGIKVVIRDEYP